jgi:hypothetical protein
VYSSIESAADVRFSPNSGARADIPGALLWAISGLMHLFDHLVGELLQVRRNFEADRLGGFEIDD